MTETNLHNPAPAETAEMARSAAQTARRNAEVSDFQKTEVGNPAADFETVSNRQVLEGFEDQEGSPKDPENYTNSEREAWLKDGRLPGAEKAAEKKEAEDETDTK